MIMIVILLARINVILAVVKFTVQSSGIVAVMVTQLGHIFRKYGKGDNWNGILSLGNPVFSPLQKSMSQL